MHFIQASQTANRTQVKIYFDGHLTMTHINGGTSVVPACDSMHIEYIKANVGKSNPTRTQEIEG